MMVCEQWMGYLLENPEMKWMILGGYPYFRKPPGSWSIGESPHNFDDSLSCSPFPALPKRQIAGDIEGIEQVHGLSCNLWKTLGRPSSDGSKTRGPAKCFILYIP